ncbi:MAG: DUF262 domain-containing protein [Oscillatoriaceae cyanobacterium Prado104]|jgi:hypothetical protein|nr:DUF262 domain-containing protein [Oscillatoriaceae cyanobacterium Prado104]
MSITPRGMSIQEAYGLFREGSLLVNRRYQRKLVWTVAEKERLIGSILKGYPIPLFLLAVPPQTDGSKKYEIIDGMQRFNAIFSFIENGFTFEGKYFDVLEFTRAKQLSDEGIFQRVDKDKLHLSRKECADLLDYQLAVTIYPVIKEDDITEVFGRINSSGKHLSRQERRQAGMTNQFAEMVRKIAVELRGDASPEVLLLFQMPEISIDSKTSAQGYHIKAEDTLWCKQGVLTVSQLRDSEDEQMIADIAASILRGKPLPVDADYLDKLYDPTTEEFRQIEEDLAVYQSNKLSDHIKTTFSVLRETIEAYSPEAKCLQRIVNPGSVNPIRSAFYTIFMAFFDLIVRQERSPVASKEILESLEELQKRLVLSKNYKTTKHREKNIDQTKGLVEKYFAKKEPSVLGHGVGLALDFENSLNRSRLETTRYEFKQGLLCLDKDRNEDDKLITKIIETICGIANLGPDSDGYLFIGVADSEKDAKRIQEIDGITPVEVNKRYVVGIDREASIKKISLENYVKRLVSKIINSELSEPLKTQLMAKFDTILYRNRSVVRITIPAQKDVSFVGQKAFTRMDSSTIEVSGPQLLAVYKHFQR